MVTRDAGAERLQTTRRFSSQNRIEIILGRFPINKTQKSQQFFRFRSRDVIVTWAWREPIVSMTWNFITLTLTLTITLTRTKTKELLYDFWPFLVFLSKSPIFHTLSTLIPPKILISGPEKIKTDRIPAEFHGISEKIQFLNTKFQIRFIFFYIKRVGWNFF